MIAKSIAEQRIFEDLCRYWQSEAEEMQGRVNRMAENERLYLANHQLIEANELLAIDGHNL
jgi:hypothetical protein